jgi:2,5-diamino-6-(ribosylamino)-4(3H)-pyrimidinone 5'-phosphate reductase
MSRKSSSRTLKRPFIFSNFAMTADGKIAFAESSFVPFSSRQDHQHMMELRATADAVMCGARTVTVTQTILGNGGEKYRRQRLKRGLAEYPLRIIVSGSGRINPQAKIFHQHFSPIIVLTTARIAKRNRKKLESLADDVKILGEHDLDFPAAMQWLHTQWRVKRLLCEGGGELHDALCRAGLVDELNLTFCPKIFGGRNAPTIAGGAGFNKISTAKLFKIKSLRCVGNELFAMFHSTKIGQF